MSGLFAGTKWERPVTCERCGKPRDACACPRNAAGEICPPSAQPVRVSRERRGGGRWVTVISGLDERATDMAAMLKQFRSSLGAGGTIADGRIELPMGYAAKPSGG
ncbi:MAG: translation initiation factor [Planctomycetes bacterium]|nr:translation initiation factor [Planctomycetota bacterium]